MSSFSLTSNPADNIIRLSGRTLVVARSLWFVVCITATLTFLFALPFRWITLTHPSPTNFANLNALGLSPTFFAAYSLCLEIVIAAPYLVT